MKQVATISTTPYPRTSARGRALVTGGTGAVGPVLVQYLLDQGFGVRVLARQAPLPGVLPSAVEFVRADIAADDELLAAARGVDVVFHLAAKLHVNNPQPSLAEEYRRVNVEGTRQIVKAARVAGVRRLVLFSTICVYGPSVPGQIWDESTPINPDSAYGASKAAAEEIVLAALRPDSGEPLGVVLRLAAVYGPRVKGNYARLIAALQRGHFMPVGGGSNRRTLVYDQDVARAAVHVAEHPAAPGQIYNLTDGAVHTFDEIVAAICRSLNRPQPRYHLPVAPVQIAAALVEEGFRRVGRVAPIDSSTVAKLLEDVAVSGERLQRDLGFRPEFDLQSGWHNCVTGPARKEPQGVSR